MRDEGIRPQHCTSSPLQAVPVNPSLPSQSPGGAPARLAPPFPWHACAEAALAPRRKRSCPPGCILGRQGSLPEGSRRQGQGLVRRFHLGICGLRHLRRVARAGEGPALLLRRSRGQPDPRVPCLPAPAALAVGTPSPTALITHHLGVNFFCGRSPTTSAPSAIPNLTDRFRMAIPHLTLTLTAFQFLS